MKNTDIFFLAGIIACFFVLPLGIILITLAVIGTLLAAFSGGGGAIDWSGLRFLTLLFVGFVFFLSVMNDEPEPYQPQPTAVVTPTPQPEAAPVPREQIRVLRGPSERFARISHYTDIEPEAAKPSREDRKNKRIHHLLYNVLIEDCAAAGNDYEECVNATGDTDVIYLTSRAKERAFKCLRNAPSHFSDEDCVRLALGR